MAFYFNVWDGPEPSTLRDYQKWFPRESIGLLDMVNNPLLERLGQRPRWFPETQFGIRMTSCRYRQGQEASVWEWDLTAEQCLWAHAGLHRGEQWRPFSHGRLRSQFVRVLPPWPRCSSLPEDPERCPRLLLSVSARHLSTSVLPSSGGKQPVTVGLLWIQQAAFVSPNSETLWKATEWAGDCFPGREPQVWSTTVGRGNCIYAPGPGPVCASSDRHRHSQTTRTHANHMSTHASQSSASAEFIKSALLHMA